MEGRAGKGDFWELCSHWRRFSAPDEEPRLTLSSPAALLWGQPLPLGSVNTHLVLKKPKRGRMGLRAPSLSCRCRCLVSGHVRRASRG